jgi:hypothetical protein
LHFNTLNTKPPPPEIEVLKRAGLIMAMTAWETYVEDRLIEAAEERLHSLGNEGIANLVMSKLTEEIKRLNNPDSSRAIQLFRDYAGVNLSSAWQWNGVDHKTVKNRLNNYLKLRGDIVHRPRPVSPDAPANHPVKKVDLEKAISFLKLLVDATERAFDPS